MISKKKIATLIVIITLLLVALVQWIIKTEAGRDFALGQIQMQLPVGSQLQWKTVQGNLDEGLQFEQIAYSDATQRFEASSLNFNIKLSPLLFRKMHSDFVVAKHVRSFSKKKLWCMP